MSDSIRQRYKDHYTKKVSAFVRDVGEVDGKGIPEVHLPLWGHHYEQAELKIAIVGRDTKYWGSMSEFLSAATVCPETAIFRGEAIKFGGEGTFHELGFLNSTNNFGTSFWDTALQFLAFFHKIPDSQELKKGLHDKILGSFVWAETNAVEFWGSTAEDAGADFESWRKVKKSSADHLDSFLAILEIFRPRVAIVMHWTDDYWDCTVPFEIIGDHVAYAFCESHRTHLFNIAHPNWLRGERRDAMFDTIFEKWRAVCITH